MSNLRVLDPFFGNDVEAAIRRFFSPGMTEPDSPYMKMRIDVTEGDKAFKVKADIPGVKKEDIAVKVDGDVVSIEAQMKSEKETVGNGDKVLRSERHYGVISRTFSLGQNVDEAKVNAKYMDGVLTLELPKKASRNGSTPIVIQ